MGALVPRVCTICTHSQKETIDAALVAGESFRYVALRFGTSATALFRHKAEHLPASMTKAQEAKEITQADDLLGQVRELQRRTMAILDTATAEETSDLKIALAAIREARGCLELLAKLTGELAQEGTVSILLAPEWVQVRALVLTALSPYPEARTAVAANLAIVETVGG
jgi:hypothetical protein